MPSKVPKEGHGLQGLQGGRSPKRLDRIFLFCIFLNLLNPLGLPISLVALLELKNLPTVGLGCEMMILPHSPPAPANPYIPAIEEIPLEIRFLQASPAIRL